IATLWTTIFLGHDNVSFLCIAFVLSLPKQKGRDVTENPHFFAFYTCPAGYSAPKLFLGVYRLGCGLSI
ncbi:MAG: hypothetical protein ACYSUY_17420, partial [Planctomycetota bacterium]